MEETEEVKEQEKKEWWLNDDGKEFGAKLQELIKNCFEDEDGHVCFQAHLDTAERQRSRAGIEKKFNGERKRIICWLWEFANRTSCERLYNQCGNTLCLNVLHYTADEFTYRLEKLLDNCERDENDCLNWRGPVNSSGYGMATGFGSAPTGTHRLAWLCANRKRETEKGLHVRHGAKCCKTCCNPEHLKIGTAAQNNRDQVEHGKSLVGSAHPRAKIDEATALAIFASRNDTGLSINERAEQFGLSRTAIKSIDEGQSWSSVTGLEKKEQTKSKRSREEAIALLHIDEKLRLKIQTRLDTHSHYNENNCKVWQKHTNHAGYGMTSILMYKIFVHVAAWTLKHKTTVPPNMLIRHGKNCSRACCNVDHLTLGNFRDNAQDKIRDGTVPTGEKPSEVKID
jgi:hypothetical protein